LIKGTDKSGVTPPANIDSGVTPLLASQRGVTPLRITCRP
jgi:hypothetical protein